jgi:hypothetical protein
VVVAEHLGVARVLPLPVVAPADVDGQAQAPHGDEGEHGRADDGVADPEHAGDHEGHRRDRDEAEAPGHVDDAVPPGCPGHTEGGGEDRHDRDDRDADQEAEGREVERRRHGRWWCGQALTRCPG